MAVIAKLEVADVSSDIKTRLKAKTPKTPKWKMSTTNDKVTKCTGMAYSIWDRCPQYTKSYPYA